MTQSDWEGLLRPPSALDLALWQSFVPDWNTLLVFADWLEEQGKTDYAKATRWCGQQKVFPNYNSSEEYREDPWAWSHIESSMWYRTDYVHHMRNACLPKEIWNRLPIREEQRIELSVPWIRTYSTLERAIVALATAMEQL